MIVGNDFEASRASGRQAQENPDLVEHPERAPEGMDELFEVL